MSDAYSNFMIYKLKDTGERERLYITEQEFRQNNGSKVLNKSQVALIVKEDLRRIYIWNGMTSPVRKKFIASRVATELQQELIFSAKFHRCKIVSVDQGEEPLEFLNAFGFTAQVAEAEVNEQLQFVALDKANKSDRTPPIKTLKVQKSNLYTENRPSFTKPSKSTNNFSNSQQKEILNKILSVKVPENYEREHILIGNNTLYGEIIKKAEIFGKSVEDTEWEPLTKLPKEIFELEGHKLRVHINYENKTIEAIEILQMITSSTQKAVDKKFESKEEADYNKWTVKQLKEYCKKNNIKVPSDYRKAQIIKLVKGFNQS
ncbi:MAG: hypothetical protein ACFFD2_15110 [Promethearchaeota archaeon]